MWEQKIEYEDAETTLPPPVKKQVRNGEKFVPLVLYKIKGWPGMEKENWLLKTFGHPGVYKDGRFWDYSKAGNFIVMDQKVYTWYQMKWSKQ